ncbi:hypothetical protein GCM10025880_09200 [Methylorubrum aminovorans]|nr:hypothetical protein GCM10025880_09200 [Methylorubrum aminovorans]
MARTGQSMPAKVRYGAITVTPRAQGSAFSRSPGVHPAIDRAYDNPGVRFGDRVRGGARPTSSAGETTCHFSQTSVSKTSPIREMIKAARGGRRLTGSRAAAHVLYVEREGAPEQIRGKGQERLSGEAFTAEIERRGLDRSAVAQQAYIERAGAAEGMERKPCHRITDEELDALDEASFGTIGETVEERTRFWLAVEEAEATPKGDRVTIKPAENPAWWARVAEHVDQAPPAAQKPIRDALARDDGDPFDIKLTIDKAFALHQWAVGLDPEAPLEISPGRGGRTQTRVIAELPHEIDGRERLQIVRDFTQKLAEKGFPYWAVIHAPDANNDARNFHVHIAYYDRPAAKIQGSSGKGDVWDFEIQEERRYPNRTKYLVRPYQQNRLRETNDQDWVTELRKHWETVSNRVLEEAGVSKRYNLGTYESMGIDLEPLKHINSRTFNKERKGELTEEGPVLARRQWDTVHDRLVKEHEDRARKREGSIAGMADHAARLVAPQSYGSHRVAEVKRLGEMGVKASFQLALLELNQDLTRLVTDRITSRPKLMMNAADKEEQKNRKKRGEALDAPPQDRPVAGAGLFGLSHQSEVVRFLTTIYDGALRLDAENARRTETARHNVRLIVQELKAWMAEPARPLQVARRYAPEAVQSLDDPARTERRESSRGALQEGFREAVESRSAEILRALKAELAHRSLPQAAQSAPAAAPPSAASQKERPVATASPTVSSPLAKPSGGRTKPRYTPGRLDGPAPQIGQTGFRPRPEHADLGRFLHRPTVGTGAPRPPEPTRETSRTHQAFTSPQAEPGLPHTGGRFGHDSPTAGAPMHPETCARDEQPSSGMPRVSHGPIDAQADDAGPPGMLDTTPGNRLGAPSLAQLETPVTIGQPIETSPGAPRATDTHTREAIESRVPTASYAGPGGGRASPEQPEAPQRRGSHPARSVAPLALDRGQRPTESATARAGGEGVGSVSPSVTIGAATGSEDERLQPGLTANGPSVPSSSGIVGSLVGRGPADEAEGCGEPMPPNLADSVNDEGATRPVPHIEPVAAAHASVSPAATSAVETVRIVGAKRPGKKIRARDRSFER